MGDAASIQDLLAASSLGSPEAMKLRSEGRAAAIRHLNAVLRRCEDHLDEYPSADDAPANLLRELVTAVRLVNPKV